MKPPSDELFRLIHSLTKSEKRYFKLFTKIHVRGNENNYIKLFDAIERQDKYDEEKIKRKFKGHHFISYLPVEKVQLYNLIIRSLTVYGSTGDIAEAALFKELNELKILFKKGLLSQALRVAEKGIKKSEITGKYSLGIEFEKWKMKILYQKGVLLDERNIQQVFATQYDFLEKEKNIAEYLEIQAKLFYYLRMYHGVRSKKELQKVKSIINVPLQKDVKRALTYQSLLIYHNNLSLYYHFLGNFKKHYDENKKLVELNRDQSRNVYNYFSALVNYFNSCVLAKKLNSCDDVINEIESLSVSESFDEKRKYSTLFLLRLTLLLSRRCFDEAYELVIQNERKIIKLRNEIANSTYIIIVYKIVYLYFIQGKNADALRWFNNYYNKINKETIRNDVQSISKILYLILQYESGNADILEYLIKDTYRWFLKQQRLFKYEKAILHFIRNQLGDTTDSKKLLRTFTLLKSDLEKIKQDRYERMAFDNFDITAWLESKISGRAFKEVLMQKVSES